MIQLKNVSADYAVPGQTVHALRCVDLRLPVRGMVVVSGPSGSGKTTLLRLLRGDVFPARGELRIGGELTAGWSASRWDAWRRAVGETDRALPMEESTVGENMMLCARTAGKSKKAAGEQTLSVLRLLGMEDLSRSLPKEMCREEQTLSRIGCALVRDSACLLCDDPLRELSPEASGSVLSILLTEAEKRLVVLFTDEDPLPEEKTVLHVSLQEGQAEIKTTTEPTAPARNGAPLRRVGKGLSFHLLLQGLGRGKSVPTRLLCAFLTVGILTWLAGSLQEQENAMTQREQQILSAYPITIAPEDVPSGDLASLADWLEGRVQGTQVFRQYETQPVIYTFEASGASRQIQPAEDGSSMWTELLAEGEALSTQYELCSGRYPVKYTEAVVILSPAGEIDRSCLLSLGMEETESVSEVDLLRRTMRLVIPTELYVRSADGCWSCMSGDSEYVSSMVRASESIEIVGVVRPIGEAAGETERGGVGYLRALSEYVRERIQSSGVVTAQLADPETDVTTLLPFDTVGAFTTDPARQRELLIRTADGMTASEAVSFYRALTGQSAAETEASGLLHTYFNMLDGEELADAFESYVSSRYSPSTQEENLTAFGYAGAGTLTGVQITAESFAARNSILSLLGSYSEGISLRDSASVLSDAGDDLITMQTVTIRRAELACAAMGAILVLTVMGLSVRFRRREGLALNRLGISRGDHRLRMGEECFLLGLSGGIPGALAALLVIRFTGGSYTEVLLPALLLTLGAAVVSLIGGLCFSGIRVNGDY